SCPLLLPASAPPDPSPPSLHDALPILDPHHAAALGAILVLGHAPLQVQAGVQHGHQNTLTGVALAPDTFHPYLIIAVGVPGLVRSEEHTSELQSRFDLVCRLLLEKKNR